jgi:quercetin dioxygenase-like cupin family protein
MPSTAGPETLDYRPAMGQTMVITRKSLETGGEVSRVEIDLEAGQGFPFAHIHPGQRETFTVDAGELVVIIDGESHVVTAGESIEIPTGAAHRFANRSDKPVRFSAEHLPALRIEEYLRLVHRTVEGRKATLPLILRVVRIQSSYGDTVMDPPGMPRVLGKVMSGVGRLVGYPTGKELAASLK